MYVTAASATSFGNRCTWTFSDSFIDSKFSKTYFHQALSEHFTINWNHVNLSQSVIITNHFEDMMTVCVKPLQLYETMLTTL